MASGGLRLLMAVAMVASGVGLAAAETPSDTVLLKDDSGVEWGPSPASLPPGLQFSVLSGNPEKPGPFTIRLKPPPHFTIAPHTHATAENLTVLSGSLVHDMGNTMGKDRAKVLATGGFLFLPGNTPHSVWTDADPAEIQVTGTGPFGLHYINPKDDPGNAVHGK